jgi:hypothetical protein
MRFVFRALIYNVRWFINMLSDCPLFHLIRESPKWTASHRTWWPVIHLLQPSNYAM